MAMYSYDCDMDHEKETITVEADNDDAAMEMMMAKVKSHLGEKHSDMAEMSDDDMKAQIMGGWKKE